MADNYWTSGAGKRAIAAAGTADAAGAMKVGPTAPTISGGAGGKTIVRGPFIGNKLLTQGPTTGFGSFKTSAAPTRAATGGFSSLLDEMTMGPRGRRNLV